MNSKYEHFKINVENGKVKDNYVFKGKKYRISVLSDVLLRLEYNEEGKFNDYPTLFAINRQFKNPPKITVKEDDKFLNITNDYFIVEYSKEKPFEASKLVPDTNLRVTLKNTDKIWYYNHPEVRNFKGTAHAFDTDKNGIKIYNGLYSTDGFASINDTATPVFVSDGSVKKNPSDGTDIYLFMYRKDFGKALQSYFELTGYPNLPPRYALGVWWNKNEDYNEEEIKDIVDDFKRSGIPLSNMVLGKTWRTNNKPNEISPNYEFDKTKFPVPKDLITYLHDNNVYLGLDINTKNGINEKDAFYKKAKEITKIEKGIIPFNAYNTNLLYSFYEEVIDSLINVGIDNFFISEKNTDFINEFMLTHYTYKNFSKTEQRRGLVLARNAGYAPHRYPVLYSGETLVSWRTLKYLPFYNSTSSNIGVTWWSHDIGGYKGGTEDRELYARYVQLGVYSPIFRFSSDKGHYYKREPWRWDVKTQKIVKDYTRIRHRLIPYIYTEAYKYAKLGTPFIQPLYYKYPSTYDEPLYKNEYFFGSELFVSPITDPKDSIMNRVVQRIFIPEGMWYEFKTGKKFPGGKRYVTFYKDEDYPVFAKSGSILPMAKLDDENLNDTSSPKKLEIQVFPGESNSYNLYEDDGTSNLYKEGYYIITNIDYNYRQNNYTLIIRPVEGKKGIIPEKRDYKIRFRNTKQAEYVKVNIGVLEAAYNAYTDENDFIVEVNDVDTTSQLTINCGGHAIEIDAVRLINEDIDEIISDLQIETKLKEKIANILFDNNLEIRKKRIAIRKLRSSGLNGVSIKMFLKLLEYISEI